MARAAETYRGARRNAVLRGETRGTWGPQHYYSAHRADYHTLRHPRVRPNKRDRSDSMSWIRANPFKWQRQASIADYLRNLFGPLVSRSVHAGR